MHRWRVKDEWWDRWKREQRRREGRHKNEYRTPVRWSMALTGPDVKEE